MDIGQVGFKVSKDVIKIQDVAKDKDVLKRLVKTQEEKYPNLEDMRAKRDAEEARLKKEHMKQLQKEKEAQEAIYRAEKLKWNDSINHFNDDEKMMSNKDVNPDDDFM